MARKRLCFSMFCLFYVTAYVSPYKVAVNNMIYLDDSKIDHSFRTLYVGNLPPGQSVADPWVSLTDFLPINFILDLYLILLIIL